MSKFVNIRMPQSELDKFERWTDQLSRDNRVKCQTLVETTLRHISRMSMMFAPVGKKVGTGSGHLRASYHPVFTTNKLGGSVYSSKDYAPYVEFGTGSGVVAPDDVADYAMTFKGAGIREVNNRAQPHFFPAVRIGEHEMIAKLKLMGFR